MLRISLSLEVAYHVMTNFQWLHDESRARLDPCLELQPLCKYPFTMASADVAMPDASSAMTRREHLAKTFESYRAELDANVGNLSQAQLTLE